MTRYFLSLLSNMNHSTSLYLSQGGVLSHEISLHKLIQYNFVYPTIVGPDDYTRLYLCSDIAIDHFNVFLTYFFCHFIRCTGIDVKEKRTVELIVAY